MIGRRALIVVALIAGTASGVLYLASTQRAAIVVASRDVDPPRVLTASDVEVRSIPAELLPEGAITTVEDAIGRTPLAPLMRGQLILRRAVVSATERFSSGLALPGGMRAIAIPVTAADAAGGTVRPGATVDVVSVPAPGRAAPERTTELLATGALVLDVRSESGGPFMPAETAAAGRVPDRIGSVVLAVTAADALWLADRVTTSTFVLTLRAP